MVQLLKGMGIFLGSVVLFVVMLLRLPFVTALRLLRGGPRFRRAIRPYERQFDVYGDRATWERSIEGAPRHAVLLYSLDWAAREVLNGGFWQFFHNSTGVLAPEAAAGFRAIGMAKTAQVIEAAMARLGQPYPFDQGARQLIVGEPGGERYRHMFTAEDDRFFELASGAGPFGGSPKYYSEADSYAEKLRDR